MTIVKEVRNILIPKNNGMDRATELSIKEVQEKSKQRIYFTFEEFKFYPIRIEGIFNNYYRDSDDFFIKTNQLLLEALPMFSNETVHELLFDHQKSRNLHFHHLEGKYDVIERVLIGYEFPRKRIDDIIEGKRLYQFALQAKRSSTRLIVEQFENILSALFIDVNHHIYLNESISKDQGSLFYEYCPTYECGSCTFMDNLDECFAFDYLDQEKLKESYGFSYSGKVTSK